MNVLHLIINNKKTAAINCRTLTIAKCHSDNCELTPLILRIAIERKQFFEHLTKFLQEE